MKNRLNNGTKTLRASKFSGQIGIYIVCVITAIVCIFPFWALFVNSTRSTQQIQQIVSFLPSTHFFENYRSLVSNGFNYIRAFFNSLIIAVLGTALSVYFSALTAYGFWGYEFKGRRQLYTLILIIIMLPGQLGLIGFYKLVVDLKLLNSYIPLILPSIASAGTVFFLSQYYKGALSKDIVEAARIDGAGEIRIFNRIIVPMIVPALATMSIFGMVGSWNNYVMPLMILSSTEKYTMPMMVQLLRGSIYATNYGAVYLGLFITAIPLIVIYLLLSKFIIRGIAMGGVKE